MMTSRKRRSPQPNSVAQRAKAKWQTVVALIGVAAGVATIAHFFGIGPGPTPTRTPDGTVSPAALVAITAAALVTEDGQTIYELEGTATGVTDPPWRIFVVAKPTTTAASVLLKSGEWAVSSPVTPGADGVWKARLPADQLPPGSTGVSFQPVLVLSEQLSATPKPSFPLIASGKPRPSGSAAPPPSASSRPSVVAQLRADGPDAAIVEAVFDAFVKRLGVP
jgi:hypothetical protein